MNDAERILKRFAKRRFVLIESAEGKGVPLESREAAAEQLRRRRASTNRPTIVVDGVEHPLTPGWRWPARAERTEMT